MTREIKFRAWAVASKKMFELDEDWEFVNGKLRQLPNTILMQFTGLYDKNGNEIFEGDILKPIDGVMKLNRLVEFMDGAFCYHIRETRRSGGYIPIGKHRAILFEILGNIYENPELLK